MKIVAMRPRGMCDYSLYEFPNRLAHEREVLIVHRFPSGTLGLASITDLHNAARKPQRRGMLGFWAGIQRFFEGRRKSSVCAICVPPGARLIVKDIPISMQRSLGLSTQEAAVFLETSAQANSYRDAVQFPNGQTLRLQDLREGQRVEIRSLGSSELVPEPEPFVAVLS